MVRPNFRVTSLAVSGCLLVLLAACGPFGPTTSGPTPTASTGNATATPTTGGATPIPTTAPMPATQTTCPPAGTARAAVFAPLVLGSHQNIVYIFNQGTPPGSSTGEIKRYDASTGQKVIIVSNSSIYEAKISADGQWILFTTGDTQGTEVNLHMVRMDGQGLQTLYCTPNDRLAALDHFQWTPDHKTVVFMKGLGKVDLLDLTTGHLQVELMETPPAIGKIVFSPVAWLDDTHLYLTSSMPTGPNGAPPQSLYVLDAAKGANQQVGDLIKVFDCSGFCMSFDSSFDNAKLFISTRHVGVNGTQQGPSSIISEPALGGTQTTVYSSQTLAITTVRVISQTTMLLLIENSTGDTSHNGLWKMNLDGTELTRLTTDGAGQISYLNITSQYPWSNVSRDGTMYAMNGWVGTSLALLIGSLEGTSPSAFATVPNGGGSLAIVGWTTM
jgi:hypothetical protein